MVADEKDLRRTSVHGNAMPCQTPGCESGLAFAVYEWADVFSARMRRMILPALGILSCGGDEK